MGHSTDVIIVGGGIHGASLAFHLAQRGVQTAVKGAGVYGIVDLSPGYWWWLGGDSFAC